MSNYLNLVKEFHKTFQPETVVDVQVDLNKERIKLRLNLLFEELSEFAEASGVESHYLDLLNKKIHNLKEKSEKEGLSNILNKKNTLDSFCDLQYVLSGAILEFGMDSVFEDAFFEVHRSNMSKSHDNEKDAEETKINLLKNKKEESYIEKHNEKFIVKRSSDGKIIKNINYSSAKLDSFIK
jgi:predicted HAD superfamily Cof-like phosphohydrolase